MGNNDIIKPTKVRALKKYVLWIEFADGLSGQLDLSHLRGKGVFKYWERNNNFFKVRINRISGAVRWDRDIELCPISIYEKLRHHGIRKESA